ncbi:MAG: cytochrome c family protein [Deltaproteobacteria bacterium]|nr:cytochrome c family protein [Deltaproteobacteria bacterium]
MTTRHSKLASALAALTLLAGVLLFPPGSAMAAGAAGPAPSPATLAELITRYDSAACGECHPEIYRQWQKSHHARPWMGIRGYSFMAKHLQKGPLAVKAPEDATLANFPCAKCHLPQLFAAGDGVARELAQVMWREDKATLARVNIGCLVCHRDKAVAHHRPAPGVLYGGRDLPAEHQGEFKTVRRSAFLASPAFCGQCHGLGPNFEFTPPVQCATLYGSYLHAYVANGGSQTCLDCHMKGKDHTFPPEFSDRATAAKLYQAALPLAVEVLPYSFQNNQGKHQPMVVVTATVRNLAGHRLPDG